MPRLFKKTLIALLLPTVLLSVSASASAGKVKVDNDGDSRRVGNVIWKNQVDIDSNTILTEAVDSNQTRLVFIRERDDDLEQTSANVAINNRFQVSLHPGNYTVVDSCVGTNHLSVHATPLALKTIICWRINKPMSYWVVRLISFMSRCMKKVSAH